MKKVALLVGVSQYRDARIAPLRFVQRDTWALADCLRQTCGFDDVRVLAEAVAPQPDDVIRAIESVAVDLRAEDTFLFYFAGHGDEQNGKGYLLMPRAVPGFPSIGSLPVEVLKEAIGNLEAKQRIVLYDACRNNPQAGRGEEDNLMGQAMARDIAATVRSSSKPWGSTSLLAACSRGQRAHDWDEKQHGVFTYYLVEGLSGRAHTERGLTFEDLAKYVQHQVGRWCERMPGHRELQHPWYEHHGDPGPVFLVRGQGMQRARRRVVREGLDVLAEPCFYVESEPRLHIMTEPPGASISIDKQVIGNAPVSPQLPAGVYRIRAELAGYEQWGRRVRLGGPGDGTLRIRLKEKPWAGETRRMVFAHDPASRQPLRSSRSHMWGDFRRLPASDWGNHLRMSLSLVVPIGLVLLFLVWRPGRAWSVANPGKIAFLAEIWCIVFALIAIAGVTEIQEDMVPAIIIAPLPAILVLALFVWWFSPWRWGEAWAATAVVVGAGMSYLGLSLGVPGRKPPGSPSPGNG